MEKDFGDLDVKLALIDGKLSISGMVDTKGADIGLTIAVDSDYFIDKLAALIPGDSAVEQVALNALKLGLKAIKV